MIAEIDNKTPVSAYNPSRDVKDLTAVAQKAYMQGSEILTRSWVELNNYSVIDRDSKDKRTFNSLVDESSEDPNEAWKWRGTRGLARNKTMAMHAQLTAQFIVPTIIAQNEEQQQDQDASEVMHDLVDWMTLNSNYRPSFLMVALAELVSPVAYLEADYSLTYQTIKERDLDTNEIHKTQIIDEVLSGFQSTVLSCDQVLITNAYDQEIQRQYRIIKRKWIEYGEAQSRYGNHDNWGHVVPGMQTVWSSANQTFYDVFDEEHPDLVEEVTFLCRKDDTEVCFLGGIYMGDADVEANPIRHRDNRNAPKYNIVPFGYERITEHYFFYKSLINRVGWDDQLMDAMYAVHMNRAFLDAEPPIAISGSDKVDTGVIFPGSVAANASPDFKASPMLPPRGGNPYADLRMIEESVSDASISDTQSGQLPEASQKAYSVAQAAANAKVILQGASRSLSESIRAYGELMVDIALQHITVPQIDELGDEPKYKSFILENQVVNGKKMTKELRFDDSLIGRTMSEGERKQYRAKLLKESGYPDNKKAIYVINPYKWSQLRYLCRMEVDMLAPTNREYMQSVMERLYTLWRQDPLIDPEVLVRKTAHAFFPTGADELIAKNPQSIFGQNGFMNGAQGGAGGGGAPAGGMRPQAPKKLAIQSPLPG